MSRIATTMASTEFLCVSILLGNICATTTNDSKMIFMIIQKVTICSGNDTVPNKNQLFLNQWSRPCNINEYALSGDPFTNMA